MTHQEMVERFMDALGLDTQPVAVYYTEDIPEDATLGGCEDEYFCTIKGVEMAKQGTTIAIDGLHPGCMGASFSLGWSKEFRPGFEHFLSHNESGEGERYKKTPELAKAFIEKRKFVPANGRYCIFQQLRSLPETLTPEVVIFAADSVGTSGLHCLANYGRADAAVIAPFTAGCGSIVSEPRAQAAEAEPKAVLGMFDPSARLFADERHLTFSVPWSMSIEMLENIPGSFLEIEPWTKVRKS